MHTHAHTLQKRGGKSFFRYEEKPDFLDAALFSRKKIVDLRERKKERESEDIRRA